MLKNKYSDAILDVLNELEAVVCDPEGRVCISGSDGDRDVIQRSLKELYNIAKSTTDSMDEQRSKDNG
jgi:L-asparaginase II